MDDIRPGFDNKGQGYIWQGEERTLRIHVYKKTRTLKVNDTWMVPGFQQTTTIYLLQDP